MTRFLQLLAAAALVALSLAFNGCGKSEAPAAAAAPRPAFVALATTAGTSMAPTFGTSETVRLELCRYGDLKGNDTVIRWDPIFSLFVHHRLLHRNETGLWVTAGDNNAGPDRGVMSPEHFVGCTHKLI